MKQDERYVTWGNQDTRPVYSTKASAVRADRLTSALKLENILLWSGIRKNNLNIP